MMRTDRLARAARALLWLLLFAFPPVLYALLLARAADGDVATVLLGATASASKGALLEMGVLLFLRAYTVLILPPLAVYWIADTVLWLALGKRDG